MSYYYLTSCDRVQLTLAWFSIIILIVRKKQSLILLRRLEIWRKRWSERGMNYGNRILSYRRSSDSWSGSHSLDEGYGVQSYHVLQ